MAGSKGGVRRGEMAAVLGLINMLDPYCVGVTVSEGGVVEHRDFFGPSAVRERMRAAEMARVVRALKRAKSERS